MNKSKMKNQINRIPKPTSNEDVYEKLEKDHRKVESLFKKLLTTENEDLETREELFEQINTDLTAHAVAEERAFYPLTEDDETTHALTLEAHEEHSLVKQLLAELSEMEKDSDEWKAKAKVLSEIVDHHVEEEESKLFPKSKKFISKEDRQNAAAAVEREEEQLKESLSSSAA